MRRTSLRRLGVVLVLSALAALFLLDGVYGQGRFPPQPRPPVFQPPPVNQPQPVIPKPPAFQPQPIIPNQPIFQPQVPVFENVWTCGRCNAELSRGGVAPATRRCPKCGATIINGIGPDPGPPVNVAPVNFGGNAPLGGNAPKSSSVSTGGILLAVGIFVGGAVLLGGIIMIVIFANKGKAAPKKKKKRRIVEDEETSEAEPVATSRGRSERRTETVRSRRTDRD